MTVRELINALLIFDADETIEFALDDKEIIIKKFGCYSDLPYIMFTENEDEQSFFIINFRTYDVRNNTCFIFQICYTYIVR